MLNFRKLTIMRFMKELEIAYEQTYSIMQPQTGFIVSWLGKLALENIANSDALYHDLDHTIMVTLVGREILEGKHLLEGGVSPRDWLHFMTAVLCHDIGFVNGVCKQDNGHIVATGIDGKTVELPKGGTDAALLPYHVDRGKLFVYERFGGQLLANVDAEVIANYIEMTRFPIPEADYYQDTKGYGGLVRAADFIGQLGDPNYLRKLPALFYEFEENGMNEKIGFKSPGEMRKNYARFYWDVVSPYIQDALRYLRVTQEGKQWVASLHSHVFDIEHNLKPD